MCCAPQFLFFGGKRVLRISKPGLRIHVNRVLNICAICLWIFHGGGVRNFNRMIFYWSSLESYLSMVSVTSFGQSLFLLISNIIYLNLLDIYVMFISFNKCIFSNQNFINSSKYNFYNIVWYQYLLL